MLQLKTLDITIKRVKNSKQNVIGVTINFENKLNDTDLYEIQCHNLAM